MPSFLSEKLTLTCPRLQLTTHLFKEHLLEEDHFLDWVLKNIESCSSERLFIWLLIVSIPSYWLELTSSRRRGKILAESLLHHAEKVRQFIMPHTVLRVHSNLSF